MKDIPLVSVITPLFNSEKYIAKTIKSIASQTYENWELIVVDDASKDSSATIVEQFAEEDSRILLKKLDSNKGAAYCRNLATELSKGVFISFLDADDLWHPEKLERQIGFMQVHDCAVSFTSYVHMDAEGNLLGKRIKAMETLSEEKQKTNNYIGNLTGVYNAKTLGKVVAPNLRKRQDWALWYTAIQKSGKPARGILEDLALYRVSEDSMSANKRKLIGYNFQFYRRFLGYSWLKSVIWLLRFFWEYFLLRPKQIEYYK